MSHLVTVSLVIQDLEALDDAARKCGLELVRDQKTYRWFGQSVGDYRQADAAQNHGLPLDGRCEHAIRVPGKAEAYEIGVLKNPDGPGYRLAWDHYNRGYGLSNHVSRHTNGADLELLTQAYAVAAIHRAAARRRQPVAERVLADGSIALTVVV